MRYTEALHSCTGRFTQPSAAVDAGGWSSEPFNSSCTSLSDSSVVTTLSTSWPKAATACSVMACLIRMSSPELLGGR